MEMDSYDYKKHGIDEENLYKDNPNIHFFSQDSIICPKVLSTLSVPITEKAR